MTIETRFATWVAKLLPQEQPKQIRENVITDYLAMRYERILRLRELARREATENAKNGHPFNTYKLAQANQLLRSITDQLNSRPIFHNHFNMN